MDRQTMEMYNDIPLDDNGPSKGMDTTSEHVEKRFYDMSLAKQPVREIWQGVQALYYCDDWEYILSGDTWSKPVRFPTLRDMTNTLIDIFMSDPPEVILRSADPEEEHLVIGKKAYLEDRAESIHEKKVRRQVFADMFFFGTGIRIPGYFEITKQYPMLDDPNTYEEIVMMKDIASYRLDPRNWFVDDTANYLHDDLCMHGARDAIQRTVLPYTTFMKLYGDRSGFTTKGVRPIAWYEAQGVDYLNTNQREVNEKSKVQVVKLYEYMNAEEDWYAIVANGMTIYEGSLYRCKGTRAIPGVDYQFERRNDSYWGQTLGELLAPHIHTRDTILNLELMNLKLTLQPVLAVSGEFGYNPKTHILQPGGVWTAGGITGGKINDHIQPLVAGNTNTRSYEMMQMINGEMSVTSRTDIRNLQFQNDKTATEVLNNSQSMESHNDFIESVTEIESEAMLYVLWQQQMKAFMDEEVDDKKTKRRVKIKNYRVSETNERGVRFIEKQGQEDMFTLTEDIINLDVQTTVVDKRGDKVAKVERMGRIMQFLPVIGNIAQLKPELLETVNFEYLLEEGVSALDLDPTRAFTKNADYEDEYQLVKEEILIGNKVNVPEESRKESMVRLKWLMSLWQKEGDDMGERQKQAYQHHFDMTTANILRNHAELKAQKEQQEQMQAQMQQMGAQPGQEGMISAQSGVPQPGNAVDGQFPAQTGQMQAIPQPDNTISVADTRNDKYKR